MATRSEDHGWIYLKVVNPSEQPETLELTLPENADRRHIQQWMISARLEQHNSLQNPNVIAPVYHEFNLAEPNVNLDIPAYSVHVFCLKLMP